MYLVINKCVTAVKVSHFSGHYLPNRSTLDIRVLGSIGVVQHKEHSPEVSHIPPWTVCINSILLHISNEPDARADPTETCPNFVFLWHCGPTRPMASFMRFIDHTQRRTAVGTTPLDE